MWNFLFQAILCWTVACGNGPIPVPVDSTPTLIQREEIPAYILQMVKAADYNDQQSMKNFWLDRKGQVKEKSIDWFFEQYNVLYLSENIAIAVDDQGAFWLLEDEFDPSNGYSEKEIEYLIGK